ncbi:MAG: hypothetical protein K9H58_12705 [Bacteroidales bacterium]|nr:hypothetical protein [Bacteroidales bacterium]
MKYILMLFALYFVVPKTPAQTLIATSNDPYALANHNQRKIVRDADTNVYIVYTTLEDSSHIIKGLSYNNSLMEWGDPFVICEGNNPSLAISADNKFFLLYESNDAVSQIHSALSEDFILWQNIMNVSQSNYTCRIPVADVDSAGVVNVFWIEHISDINESLLYSTIQEGSLTNSVIVCSKTIIHDVAIANHLQYLTNSFYFALQFENDSLQFFYSADYLNTLDTIHSSTGNMPCITYNNMENYTPEMHIARFLYNTPEHLFEFEYSYEVGFLNSYELNLQPADYLCIDNLMPPIGYSFLYMDNGSLQHIFSYGAMFSTMHIMETLNGGAITYPSIAYRHYNPLYVDFIWLDGNGIYHLQDEKHIYTPHVPEIPDTNSLTVSGNPNPFSDQIVLQVNSTNANEIPIIEIYNTSSQLIDRISPFDNKGYSFKYLWQGKNSNGGIVKPGIYIVLCIQGDLRHASKIVYKPL